MKFKFLEICNNNNEHLTLSMNNLAITNFEENKDYYFKEVATCQCGENLAAWCTSPTPLPCFAF